MSGRFAALAFSALVAAAGGVALVLPRRQTMALHAARREHHVDRMIRDYGGRFVRFDQLPQPAQAAIVHYMAVDGEAWPLPPAAERYAYGRSPKTFAAAVVADLPFYRRRFGRNFYGYVEIPTERLKAEVRKNPGIDDFEVDAGDIPKHGPRKPWPVILDRDFEDTLQDGWHRFRRYVQLGMKRIPAVYYPKGNEPKRATA